MGLPVIGSNIGGIADAIIDGENGLLFEVNNHADLANKIITLIHDRDLLNSFKKKIQNSIQLINYTSTYNDLYVKIANNIWTLA